MSLSIGWLISWLTSGENGEGLMVDQFSIVNNNNSIEVNTIYHISSIMSSIIVKYMMTNNNCNIIIDQ